MDKSTDLPVLKLLDLSSKEGFQFGTFLLTPSHLVHKRQSLSTSTRPEGVDRATIKPTLQPLDPSVVD